MLFFLVTVFTARSLPGCVPVGAVVIQEHFVHSLQGLGKVVLQGRKGRTDSRGAKAMGDEAKVS